MPRGHTIDPRRKVLLEAANTLAATRRYRNQLMSLRCAARDRVEKMERLIVRIDTKLQERDDV